MNSLLNLYIRIEHFVIYMRLDTIWSFCNHHHDSQLKHQLILKSNFISITIYYWSFYRWIFLNCHKFFIAYTLGIACLISHWQNDFPTLPSIKGVSSSLSRLRLVSISEQISAWLLHLRERRETSLVERKNW